MKINGWIKASNQWKKDVPQPVAILMNYSLEPGKGLLGAVLFRLWVTSKAMTVPRPDFLHPGPRLQGYHTVAGLGELPSYCRNRQNPMSTYVSRKLDPDGMD